MSRFGHCLTDFLQKQGLSQIGLARQTGVNAANVSRWLKGVSIPDRTALGRVMGSMAEPEAAELLAAWLFDCIPPEGRGMVSIRTMSPSVLCDDGRIEWPEGMSRETQRQFKDFAELAMQEPDIMEIVQVVHGALIRQRCDQQANFKYSP